MEELYLVDTIDSHNRTANLVTNSPSTVSKQKLYNTRSIIAFLSLLLMFFFTGKISAQVTITKPNLSIPVCSGFPSSYYPLDDIIITETSTSNFSSGTNITLILSAPANFEFKANTGSVSATGGADISVLSSLTVSSSVITLTYSVDSPSNKTDRLTFSQLQIRAINVANTGNITRTGGTGTISGLITGTTLTNTLTSVTGTSPTTSDAGSNQTLTTCTTTTTLAANTPTNGTGSWSVVSGTATITTPSSPTSGVTGLALGTTETLRWTISNGSCPVSSSDVTITTSYGAGCLVYCTPTHTVSCDTNKITNLTFNTINNTSNCSDTNGMSYTNYALSGTPTTSLLIGSSYNLSITTGSTAIVSAWIDFNQNGSFEASEWRQVYTSGTNGTISISIPGTAMAGNTTLRIRSRVNTFANGSGDACTSYVSGETEDYKITLVTPLACVTPTTQPTALSLIPTGNTISGSFTLANPLADNYLVVINSTGIAPTLTDGTNYTIGSTILGGTNVIVDNDTNTSFSISSLTASTLYYVYVFSMNTQCTGGPKYLKSSPLNASTSTLTFCLASSSASTYYISSFKTTGAINDAPTNTTTYSSTGYANYTYNTPAEQIAGGGINISLSLAGGIQFVKVWVDWNKNNIFDEPSETTFSSTTAFISNTFGFVIPAGTAVGDYKMRIRSKKTDATFTSCNNEPDGETEDYTIRVIQDCAAKITSATTVERCGQGTVTLVAAATASTTSYKWYNSDGSAISGATTSSYITPSLSNTTTYYVTALNGTCESLTRKPIIAKIKPIPNITITPENPEICGEKALLEISAAGSTEVVDLFSEGFEATGLGGFTKINLANGTTATEWQQKTSVYTTTTTVWKPAISSGDNGNKFAFTTSDVSGTGKSLVLETTNNINTTGYTDLTLSFRHYFSYYGASDSAIIEISTNGTTWTPVQTYTSSQGSPGKFATVSLPLNSYVGNSTLKFRFRYDAGFCDGWAIDDVLLYGTRPLTSNFTWSGATIAAYTDAAATIPYTNQLVNTVYIKPSLAQLEVTSWSFTANVQLTNGCSASKAINVTNTSKIWQGLSTNWSDLNNWKPSGVPTLSNCVIIPNTTIIPGSNYNAYAKNLTVKSTGNLELPSTSNLTVTDFVNVNTGGVFNIRDKASLIQTNNVANTGIVNIQRTTQPMSLLDYTYWSSAVTGFTLGGLSLNSPLMYSWIPFIGSGGGNWQSENASSIMNPGMGYIVRAPRGHTSGSTYTTTFSGTPNNGTITTPIKKGTLNGTASTATVDGTDEDDEWNLIGNPYPSALDAAAFLNLAANISVIDGTIYLWTHNSQPNAATIDPFYGDYALNYTDSDYAAWNKTGGVGTAGTIAGGLGTNASTGGNTPTGYIASGQSFFVKAANSMTNGTTLNATFNNSMRVGTEGKNSDFFKLTKNQKNEAIPKTVHEIERHRIWLNLTNNSGAFSQTLLGYVAGATEHLDRSFDGESLGGNDVSFYSIIPEAQLTIQGRGLPFDANDHIPLGYNSEISGELSVRIDHIDGLFDTQNIYLEDKVQNVIHNLKDAPYVFKTEIGGFDERFVLLFTNKTLGTDTFNLAIANEVNVIVNQNVIVQSSNQLIKNIVVYDLLGRKIDSYKKVSALKYTLNHLTKMTAGLIVKITLEDDTVVSKKIIY